MSKYWPIILFLIALFVLPIGYQPPEPVSAAGNTQITVANVKNSTDLPITISTDDPVSGYQFRISYPGLTLQNLQEGAFLRQNGSTFFSVVNQGANWIEIACVLLGEGTYSTGTGTLAVLNFNNIVGAYPVTVSNIIVADTSGKPLPYDSKDGVVLLDGKDLPSGIVYPAGVDTIEQKYTALLVLLEQFRTEFNTVGEQAAADWPASMQKFEEYRKIFLTERYPVLAEYNQIKQELRRLYYTDDQWTKLTYDEQITATNQYLGDKPVLRQSKIAISSPRLDELKTVDYNSLIGNYVDPVEDFTTYTEQDPGGYVSITSNNITLTALPRNDVSWVIKDFGAGHFGDFNFRYTIRMSDWPDQGSFSHGALENIGGSTFQDRLTANDGIGNGFHRAGSSYGWYLWDFTDDSNDVSNMGGTGTWYAEWSRSGTTMTTDIYDDAERTSLVDTLTTTVPSTTYRYFQPFDSRDQGIAAASTGWIADYDLQEATGPDAPVVTTDSFSLVEETTATVNATVSTGNATSYGVRWGTASDTYTEYSGYTSSNFTGEYSINLTSLTPGRVYYASANATGDGGSDNGSELSFLTKPNPATSFNSTSQGSTWAAFGWINGTGTDNIEIRYQAGASPVADNTSGTLGLWDAIVTSGNISGLSASTQYTFRIFTHANNSTTWSTADGSVYVTLTTDAAAITPPTVVTGNATDISYFTATGQGNITDVGSENATLRGFEWGIGSFTDNVSEGGDFASGNFTGAITGLIDNTEYQYRAFAQNGGGISYGATVNFTTLDALSPTVVTGNATAISYLQVTGQGNITDVSAANATQRGFQYGIGGFTDNVTEAGDFSTGNFTALISGLADGTEYQYRAFAVNAYGIGYGATVNFTTLAISTPTVATGAASAVSYYSATGNGEITVINGENAQVRGFQYGIGVFTDNVSQSGDYGAGVYSLSMLGLSENTEYQYRAFASNSKGISYGASVNFTTLDALAPAVVTVNASAISYTTATGNGNITLITGENATQRGFQYGIAAFTDNISTSGDYSTGNYSIGISGLLYNSEYQYRAFALNTQGISYGATVNFTTLNATVPTVVTVNATSVSTTTATGRGNITNTGGPDVTQRGFQYGVGMFTANVSTSGTYSTGKWSQVINSLAANTTYQYRAFAVNLAGIAYGATVNFTTSAAATATGTSVGVILLQIVLMIVIALVIFVGTLERYQDIRRAFAYSAVGVVGFALILLIVNTL